MLNKAKLLVECCVALRKVQTPDRIARCRLVVWILKVLMPEGLRFLDHNYRPYLSYQTLTETDRHFLMKCRDLYSTSNPDSAYCRICLADINALLDESNGTSELLHIADEILARPPRDKPLRLISWSKYLKLLVLNKKKLAADAADIALKETYRLLENSDAEIKPFLVSGTLLGLVRENRFLSHDIDIDIGVIGRENSAGVKRACIDSALFSQISEDQDFVLKLTHNNGVNVDVFFHWQDNSSLLHGSSYLLWSNTPFTFVHRPLYGLDYRIPENDDLYLKENYGEWRVPQPKFNILYDTPNVAISPTIDGLAFFCLNAAQMYYQCNEAKRNVLRELMRNFKINTDLSGKTFSGRD